MIYYLQGGTINGKCNRYLRRQYGRLKLYRNSSRINSYWKLSWDLLTDSWSYRIASLNSWQPTWYKSWKASEIHKVLTELHDILSLKVLSTRLTNVWIESPKNKWRQLCVPGKGWRLYYHMLNQFLTYIYSPSLDSGVYEGFIYERGCKSWWEEFIWSNKKDFPHILEMDLSSGFPNLNKEALRTALESDGLTPIWLINLILHHFNTPPPPCPQFPTLSSYVENKYNEEWRKSNRSVPMGIGISPILFVITQNWVYKRAIPSVPGLTHKWYADDGSFYFTTGGLNHLLTSWGKTWWDFLDELLQFRNPLISLLNSHPLFRSAGLRICTRKSRFVKLFGLWLRPYKSLGLEFRPSGNILSWILTWIANEPWTYELRASTHGRAPNPVKKKLGTLPSYQPLKFKRTTNKRVEEILNFETLKSNFKPYFGLLMAKLYYPKPTRNANSLLLWKSRSFLGEIILSKKALKKLGIKLDIYNSGCKVNELWLQSLTINEVPKIWSTSNPNLNRCFKLDWTPIKDLPLKSLDNPLRPSLDSEYGGYQKFIELNLTSETLIKLEQEWKASRQYKPL